MTRKSLPPDGGLGFPTFRGLHITPKFLKPVRWYTIWSKKRFILWMSRMRALITIFLAPHHRLFGRQSSAFPAWFLLSSRMVPLFLNNP